MQWEWFLAIWWLLRARARVCTYPIKPNDPATLCLNETSGTDSQLCNWTEKNKSKNISLRFISFDFRIIVTSFCCRWFHHSFFLCCCCCCCYCCTRFRFTAQYIVRLYTCMGEKVWLFCLVRPVCYWLSLSKRVWMRMPQCQYTIETF